MKKLYQQYKFSVIPSFLFIKNTKVIEVLQGVNRSELLIKINILSNYQAKPIFIHDLESLNFNIPEYNQNDTFEITDSILNSIFRIRHIENEFYFEKQIDSLCGLHALNNALQYPLFTKQDLIINAKLLQQKEESLFFNQNNNNNLNVYFDQHGNFNVDVLEMCLIQKKFNLKRFRESKIREGIFLVCVDAHWFALRQYEPYGLLWKLDSLKNSPEIVDEVDTVLSKYKRNIFEISKINN